MTAAPFPDEVRDRVTSYIKHQGAKSNDAIIDLVRTSQQRYLDVISNVADDVANRKPADNEWSVRELTRHVISAKEGVAMLVHNLSRGEPPASGRTAGQLIEDDGSPFAQLVVKVGEVNAQLVEAVTNLPDTPNLEQTANHPFFGPLNCKEWAAFQRVHDEDHVQHAQKILAVVS